MSTLADASKEGLIHWAYLGDYTTGVVSVFSAKEKGAMVVAPEPEIQEPVDEIDSFGWGSFTTTKKDKKKRERPPARGWVTDKVEESVPIFQNLILEEVAVDEGPVKDIKEECVPLATEDAGVPVAEGANASSSSSKGKEPEITTPSTNHSYITPPEPLHPLYLHIQLYVFSHIYLIKPLTALASTKIKTHLQKSHQTSTRNITTETFDLLEYAFSNLPEKNELLEWLARYSSWKLGELREESGRLERLLEIEGGKFAKAMVRHVLSGKKVAFHNRYYSILFYLFYILSSYALGDISNEQILPLASDVDSSRLVRVFTKCDRSDNLADDLDLPQVHHPTPLK
ncbi:hypothetical protein G7Y89_g14978 [Cudoniella acicularis]|uniref:Uncharacterized protein n=1 Tax=Cudoniella acicularis TaxID=354080 RepID=A0A8H4QWT4_9HELO|nr:hypothetical protein G7Y89_g14978 [Cudoniella acicularis]